MRTRAIGDINQLSDADMFIQISEGLEHIAQHVICIESDLQYLSEQGRLCGYNILKYVLTEEASKFLILLDAIRCQRAPSVHFSKQLNRFTKHLAKGIYSLVYGFRPINFGEIRQTIESQCFEYYLDGPNDFDWIFRNSILQEREEHYYVDYIESEGDHIWITPKRYYDSTFSNTNHYLRHEVVDVSLSLFKAGFTSPNSLYTIANIWRPIEMSDEFSWHELKMLNIKTLEELDKLGLLKTKDSSIILEIAERWLFPLYSIDIQLKQVNQKDLKEKRDRKFSFMYL